MNVDVGLGEKVSVDSGVDVAAGGGVQVDVTDGGGRGRSGVSDDAKSISPAMTAMEERIVSNLPFVRTSVEENMDGILNHNIIKGLMVAVVVRMPREVLINFLLPSSRSETMPNDLKRLSRLSARVFN